MRDKEKGWVELELKGMREGDENIVIRRDLERASNRSSYRMDGAPATQALVHEKVQELGIHVNNLCTFLPQEKVGKFTEMDPEKLLMETEKVVRTEGMDLFGTHEGLIRRQR
jgi:chromosome segregation ATPase